MTPNELITFKAAIFAETDPDFVALRDTNETGLMAEWYNQMTSFICWRSTTPTSDIANAISWASLTPNDVPDSTVSYTNRALQAQAKQINLQILIQGREFVSTGLNTIRSGLQDALTGLFTGTGGVSVGAGWTNVKTSIQRSITRGERVFSTGTGTAAQPGNLGTFEGDVSNDDITGALRS